MFITMALRIFTTILLIVFSYSPYADTTLVAVAANFSRPMSEIAVEFEKATGHSANLSLGSSGKFVSQIENGGPFEILFSADEAGAQKLIQDGYAVPNSQFIYALGKLVLWSVIPGYVDDQGKVLSTGSFKHLAVADPKLAPYGAAAMEVLINKNLQTKLQPLIVMGENIAQTYQFVSTANAELGFVALSQVIDNGKISNGSAWVVPSTDYSPIKQGAVLLKLGTNNPAALALLDYLKSAPALAIIEKYGYGLPK